MYGVFVLIDFRAATGATIILGAVGQGAFTLTFLAEDKRATFALENFAEILAAAFRTAIVSRHRNSPFSNAGGV